MVRFPETVRREWEGVAHAANAKMRMKQVIERGVRVENTVEDLRVRHEAKITFQQELEADSTPTLVIGTLDEYLANPAAAPSDMIEGVVKEKGTCIVLGPSGAGKTTLVLQMVHSILTGDDFLGQSVTAISGSVGLLSYDQDASISVNWMSRAGVPLNMVSVVNANGMGNPLAVPKFRQQIADTWRTAGVEVVVVDSFSASFSGLDQNDAGATMAYYRDMKVFAMTEVGAKALIVIVHSTDGSPLKPRGSTVHKDVADSIVAVTVKAPMLQRHVQMVKYRAALGQQEMSPVVVTPPDAVTHLVDLDVGAMALEGYALPPSAGGIQFPALPEPTSQPETDSEDEEEDL